MIGKLGKPRHKTQTTSPQFDVRRDFDSFVCLCRWQTYTYTLLHYGIVY